MAASGFALGALDRPSSRGTVYLNPNDQYGPPLVQYNTFQNPADKTIMLAMARD
ncbi:hypothetical protein BDV96DRAFT_649622 [Lophiotrema nucula]|uniref:Glucose-methanol-choline oxidoreductase C-terminal domain-containing protein n=1 Tax=Lophiotrema nucula TaxID=690887 RepID=A0A6A5YWY5_9PLEO|nr:hypothetical protein BDV96DRAFT_649622 [Lophiotrema nucula]